jgi:NAD-specific glutamate dehydrogenase
MDTNTTNTQLTIVDELKSKLSEIKDKIKDGGLSKTIYDELTGNAKVLQAKVNEVLEKKGILTQSDVNDAYEVMQNIKRSELEKQSKKQRNKLLIYGIVVIALIGGVYLYKKNK